MNEFFGLSPWHGLMAVIGGALLMSLWLPSRLLKPAPSGTSLLMATGCLVALAFPALPQAFNPMDAPLIWEKLTEIVVIVVLFATGLRIDDPARLTRWRPAFGLLAVTMPLTIFAVAALGWWLAGMTLAGALVLGAVLAPTDPVLAGDVQIGPPLEGKEHPVRFTLTTEAGLNDGLAFPFVYLAIHAAVEPDFDWLGTWALIDVGYRIVVGAVLGAVLGRVLAGLTFGGPKERRLADFGPGSMALGAVLMTYGLVEIAEGYGFIAAFVAGLVFRRGEAQHNVHRALHDFSDSIEQALTAILLVLLGCQMPALWPMLDWRHSLIGFGLLLAVRPLAGWLGLWRSGLEGPDRAIAAFYGVRGIGSVYYLAYAASNIEFTDEPALWALIVHVVFASTLIHGLTARWVIGRLRA